MTSADNINTRLPKNPGPIKPPTACSQFLASDWRATEKSSLLGFFNLTLPSGLVIKNCTFHKGPSGSRWVSLPAQTYKDKNGDIAYTNIIDFSGREVKARFQEQAMAAIEKLLRDGEPS